MLFKILPSASADDFDDLGYEFFNTTGGPDNAVNVSLTPGDFQEYEYTGGVKDDGIGESLDEFIQFAIKIVLTSTNAAQAPKSSKSSADADGSILNNTFDRIYTSRRT